jgi:hypothetical protein
VDLEDLLAAGFIRHPQLDLAVEAARPPQRHVTANCKRFGIHELTKA